MAAHPTEDELQLLLDALAEGQSVWKSADLRQAFFQLVRSISQPDDVVFQLDGFAGEEDYEQCLVSATFWHGPADVIRHAFRQHGWLPEAFAAAGYRSQPIHKRIRLYGEERDGPEEMFHRAFLADTREELLRHTTRLEGTEGTVERVNTCSLFRAFAEAVEDASHVDALVPFLDPEVSRLRPSVRLSGALTRKVLDALFFEPERARIYLSLFVGRDGWENSSWLRSRLDEARGMSHDELVNGHAPDHVGGLVRQLHATWPTAERSMWLAEYAAERGHFAEASRFAEQAVSLGADQATVLVEGSRAMLALEAGEVEAAIGIFDALIEADEELEDWVYDLVGEHHPDVFYALASQRQAFPEVVDAGSARLPDDPEFAHLAIYLERVEKLDLSDDVCDLLAGVGVTHVHQLTSIREHTVRGTEIWEHWGDVVEALDAQQLYPGFTPTVLYEALD